MIRPISIRRTAFFLLVFAPVACHSKELSRGKALALLQDFASKDKESTFSAIHVSVRKPPPEVTKLVSCQMNVLKEHPSEDPWFESCALTEAAKPFFSGATPPAWGQWSGTARLTLSHPIHLQIIEVTGIANPGGLEAAFAGAAPGDKDVHFRARYELPAGLLNLLGPSFAGLSKTVDDDCLLRRYDDGWRVQACAFKVPFHP